MSNKHDVTLELFYISVGEGGNIIYLEESYLFTGGYPIDREVRDIIGWSDNLPEGALLHSTSWRHEEDEGVILTWLVIPGKKGRGELVLNPNNLIVRGGTASEPVPASISSQDVVRHAIEHLVFLLEFDKNVKEAVYTHEGLVEALEPFRSCIAGMLKKGF